MSSSPIVRVCVSPALYNLYRQQEGVTVVVDIFRATSAICTALNYGARSVIPVASVDEAKTYIGREDAIIAAERGGEIVEGFTYGNSPLSYVDNAELIGKDLVLTTTNGTQAIEAARHDGDLVIGAFSNHQKLSEWLIAQNKDVMILCSGWKNRLNLEDTLFAGALVDSLMSKGYGYDIDSDAAITAKLIYDNAKGGFHKFLENSSHRNRLTRLNLEEDVDYCLAMNTCPIVPILTGNKIIKAEKKPA